MEKANIKKVILTSLKIAGFISVAVLAPNALQMLTMFDKNLGRKSYRRNSYLNHTINKLRDRGLIQFKKNKNGVLCARLTKKGEQEIARYEIGELQISKPKNWDKKYRVIIFDIKEWKRQTRDELRAWLVNLGFMRLQNSVWVYPYECQDVIVLLKSHFKLGSEVLYMTVDNIENDKWLKKEFDLN
jgi:DNA-binding transcriptional regulator PaaX